MERFLTLLFALGIAVFSWWLKAPPPAPDQPAITLGGALSADAAGFQRATEPRPFRFPADHGPHPDFKHEWWYVTGNLGTAAGRRFGFQWTLFRIGLDPEPEERASQWAASQLYMAHFTVTDAAGERFFHTQRVARGALELAGARATPFKAWLGDWSLEKGDAGMRLVAASGDEGMAIDLNLTPKKPVVLQGERGLSQKSAEPGNASYYYSMTRLGAAGTVTLDGAAHSVTGRAWLDREWSTSALGPAQAGWDWFSLQLDDGRDVMFYQLRLKDGGIDPHSRGTVAAPDGTATPLLAGDVTITPTGQWTSPHTGVAYPSGWRLESVKADLDLTVTPLLRDQELHRTAVRYWEGAVTVLGSTSGRGYVELAGYE